MSSSSSLYHVGSAAATTLDFADLDPDGTLTPGFFSSSEDGLDLPAFLDPALGSADLGLMHATPNQEPSPPSPETLNQWMSQAVARSRSQNEDVVLKHSSEFSPSSCLGFLVSPQETSDATLDFRLIWAG